MSIVQTVRNGTARPQAIWFFKKLSIFSSIRQFDDRNSIKYCLWFYFWLKVSTDYVYSIFILFHSKICIFILSEFFVTIVLPKKTKQIPRIFAISVFFFSIGPLSTRLWFHNEHNFFFFIFICARGLFGSWGEM